MSENSYSIRTLEDLLTVPAERRSAMFRDLEYALSLYDLAVGSDGDKAKFMGMVWTDDGMHNVSLRDEEGEEMLRLEVTDERG